MYSQTTTSGTATFNDSLDTKYTVAELLSSLANGGITPTSQYPTSMPSFVSEVSTTPTGTTTLLTPSTLTSIEQTFIELQSVPATTANSQITESGFVPPIVTSQSYTPANNMVIKQEYPQDYYSDESSQDPDWAPEPSPKRMRNGAGNAVEVTSTTGRRTGPRGRRADTDLTPEEMAKRQVRRERNKLAAAKCRQRRVDLTNTLQTQTEGLEHEKQNLETEIQQLQAQKEQLEFLLQAHNPVCSAKDKISSTPASTTSAALPRPTSLPLTSTVTTHSVSVNVSEATGVPITTPSAVFGTFGLDTMMDGHTGLTPLTGAPSCASEVARNNSDTSGSSPSDLSSPTTLMAL